MVTGSKKTWPGDFSLSYNPVKMTWWLAYNCCFVCSSNKTRIYTTCLSLLYSHTQNNYLKLVHFHIHLSSLPQLPPSLSSHLPCRPCCLFLRFPVCLLSFLPISFLSSFLPSLPTRIYMYLKPAFFYICYVCVLWIHWHSRQDTMHVILTCLPLAPSVLFFFRKHSQQSNSSGDRNFPKSTVHTWPSLCWLFCTTL